MAHKPKSTLTEAVVLKRTSVGEADRILTLLTRELGKVTRVAKGARKMTSSKRAYLEPGNHIKALLITTHSMPILTQATLLDDCTEAHGSLGRIRQLVQVLEILDSVFVEEEMEQELFDQVLSIRTLLVAAEVNGGLIKKRLEALIVDLGYQDRKDTKYTTVLEYVSSLANKPMKSWEYLKVE